MQEKENELYYIKIRLFFQILSTQIKISPIVLITSFVRSYKIYITESFQHLITG